MRTIVYTFQAADLRRFASLRRRAGAALPAVRRLMPWAAAAVMLAVMVAAPASATSTSTIKGVFGGSDIDTVVTNGTSSVVIWSIRIAAMIAIVGAVVLVSALVLGEDRFPRQKAVNWFVGTVGLSVMIFIAGQTFSGAGSTASGVVSGVGGTVPGGSGNPGTGNGTGG